MTTKYPWQLSKQNIDNAAERSFPIWLLIGWLKQSILLYSAKQ